MISVLREKTRQRLADRRHHLELSAAALSGGEFFSEIHKDLTANLNKPVSELDIEA